MKEHGVPMDRILVVMCIRILMDSNFMSKYSDCLKDRNVRKELGLDAGAATAITESIGECF